MLLSPLSYHVYKTKDVIYWVSILCVAKRRALLDYVTRKPTGVKIHVAVFQPFRVRDVFYKHQGTYPINEP